MQRRIFLLLCGLFAYAASQQNGDIRLVDGPTNIKGKLEIYEESKGDWSSVCYDYKTHPEQQGVAQFACRQLGLYNYLGLGNVTSFGFNESFPTLSRIGTTDCSSVPDPENAPQHVFRCDFEDKTCADGAEMAIECSQETRDSYSFDTMVEFYNDDDPLSMGESTSEGYVQIYLNNRKQFGPVCNMGKEDADTFCRQLSYTNALSVEDRMNTTKLNPEVLDTFHCTNTNGPCLRNCFDYPNPDQDINCPNGFSYVICTFNSNGDDELLEYYGSKASCGETGESGGGSSSNAGAIAGGVVGGILGVAIIAVVLGLVCYFVPGCYFNRKKQGSYSPVKAGTKYDAI